MAEYNLQVLLVEDEYNYLLQAKLAVVAGIEVIEASSIASVLNLLETGKIHNPEEVIVWLDGMFPVGDGLDDNPELLSVKFENAGESTFNYLLSKGVKPENIFGGSMDRQQYIIDKGGIWLGKMNGGPDIFVSKIQEILNPSEEA